MKSNAFFVFLLTCVSIVANQAQGQANEPAAASTAIEHGVLLTQTLHSTILRDNRVGLNTKRSVKIYLPPGYAASGKRYPVVYYLHNFYTNNEQLFADGRLITLIERAFAAGVVKEFLLSTMQQTV